LEFRDHTVRVLYFVLAASLFIGCSKSNIRMDRFAMTTLHPEDTVLFSIDAQSKEKSLELEAKIVRYLSRALKEEGNIRVVSSKEFFPDVAEPFYSSEDIMLLLQDTQFKERLRAARIHYIVLADVEARLSNWHSENKGKGQFGASYYRKDMEHMAAATIIDVEQGKIAGTLRVDYSTSSGYGVAGGNLAPVCCIVPIGWYGGESEGPALESLATNVARFLNGADSKPSTSSYSPRREQLSD
jgi:hypothetical protein